MSKVSSSRWVGLFMLLCVSCTCSKKKPPLLFRAIPPEAFALIQMDFKATESLTAELNDLFPPELKQVMQGEFISLRKTAGEIGVDLSKVKSAACVIPRDVDVRNVMLIFEGVDAEGMKGTDVEVLHGVKIGAASKGIMLDAKYYANLSPLGVVFGTRLEIVRKAVASYTGKGKCVSATDVWEKVERLHSIKKNYNHFRMYIWGDAGGELMPVAMEVVGVFADYEKGFHVSVVSDEEGAEKLKNLTEFTLASRISSPTSDVPPEFVELDSLLREMLKEIRVSAKKDIVSVEYKGSVAQVMKRVASALAEYLPKYLREQLLPQMHKNLYGCRSVVADYVSGYDGVFPPEMKNPKCSEGLTKNTLTGAFSLFRIRAVLESDENIIWLKEADIPVTAVPPACYQVTSDAPGMPVKDGQKFTCHAWADFDNDGKLAHWYIQGTYKKETSSFEMGEVVQDEEADDW